MCIAYKMLARPVGICGLEVMLLLYSSIQVLLLSYTGGEQTVLYPIVCHYFNYSCCHDVQGCKLATQLAPIGTMFSKHPAFYLHC